MEGPPVVVVSTRRPREGDVVRLEAAWSGAWPALLDWGGVDGEEDGAALVVARAGMAPTLDGAPIPLELQTAANQGDLPAPRVVVVSLPALDPPCGDPRLPALAGAWAIGCSGQMPTRAWDLLRGAESALSGLPLRPAFAPGFLYAPGTAGGLWRLPASAAERVIIAPEGLAATDGERGVVALEDRVEVFELTGQRRQVVGARPDPWMPPAISGARVAWVDLRDTLSGADVWTWTLEGARPLVRAVGDQRHVAMSGRFVGWIEAAAVVVEDLELGVRRRFPTDAHTSRSLSLWGPVACWEEWNGADVDIACSDGVKVQGEGDQRGPSRFGPWLLFVQEKHTMIGRITDLVIDDDHPAARPMGPTMADPAAFRGARTPVELEIAWPGSYQAWEGGAWVDRGPWPGTLSTDDAIRLTFP